MKLPGQMVALATIHNPSNAAKEILQTPDKMGIAASSRTAVVTMENRHRPRASRMGKAGRVKLRLEITANAEIVEAIRYRQTTIHQTNKTIRINAVVRDNHPAHAAAVVPMAVTLRMAGLAARRIVCASLFNNWARETETRMLAGRSPEIIM